MRFLCLCSKLCTYCTAVHTGDADGIRTHWKCRGFFFFFLVGVRWIVGSQSAALWMSSFIQCFTKLIDLNKIKRSDAANIKCVPSEGCASWSGVQNCLEHRAECVSSSVFITRNQYYWTWGGAADTQQEPLIVSGTTCHKSLRIVCGCYIYGALSSFSPLSLNTPPIDPHTKFFPSLSGTNCN